MIDVSQFKTTNALEDFSLRAQNEMTDYICDEVMTPAYVPRAQFKRYHYDVSNYRMRTTESSSKAEAQKLDWGVYTISSTAVLHKQAADVDPKDERDADPVVGDMGTDATLATAEALMIRKEYLMAQLVGTAGNYNSGLTSALISSSNRWSDAGGDPEKDVVVTAKTAVKQLCGRLPNAMAISWSAWLVLSQSAALKDRIKYTGDKSLTEEQVKNLLQLDFLHICKAQYNSNVEGNATQTLTDLWGNFAVVYVKNPDQKRRTVTFGRTYYVTGGAPSGSGLKPSSNGSPNGGFYVYKYVDHKRGSGAGRIEVVEQGMEYLSDFAAVDSQSTHLASAGYLLTNIF